MVSWMWSTTAETYNAMSKISCHALEEADLAHIHVLPVVVLLPLPAPLTPLLNHLPKRSHINIVSVTAQIFGRIIRRERERERGLLKLGYVLVASCESELPR